MRAAVETRDGVFTVDLEAEIVLDLAAGDTLPLAPPPAVPFPRVVAAAAAGSTCVAVVNRRPPLLVSYDAGTTWTEAGGGLPAGRAVAIAPDDPDLVLYAARNRLYLSRDGGRFWSVLAPELPEILAVELREA
jgi:hypothetical protein